MISKKLPGCEAIYYVYDKAGRLIFSQDGNQRLQGKWIFTIPDVFGRIVLTGLCEENANMAYTNSRIIFAELNNQSNNLYGYSIKQNLSVEYNVIVSLPLNNPEILLVNYYDNYNFIDNLDLTYLSFSEEDAYNTPYPNATGLLTGTITAILKDTNIVGVQNFEPLQQNFESLQSALYYDERGRIIQQRSTTIFPAGLECENFEYNFTNQITERHHKIVFDNIVGAQNFEPLQQNFEPLQEIYSYTYDPVGRLMDTWHNGILLSMNDYDEIGRLKTATIGGFVNHNFAYNVRSWIVGDTIPNPNFNYAPSSEGFTPPVIPPLFAEKLQYSFGGNIISNNWRNGFSDEADNDLGGYTYQYDNLNRLISATSGECSRNGLCPSFNTEYQYDKHGNPLHITRYGMIDAANFNKIDDISFSYNGNQMLSAIDVARPVLFAGSEDFKDYSNYRTEYTYDANGNMTMDKNKGISSIQYNFVNLPSRIEINSPVADAVNDYIYAADGRKLQEIQTWTEAAPISFTKSRTAPTTKTMTKTYCSNMIFTTEPSAVVPSAYPTMPASIAWGNVRTLTENGYIQNGRYYYFIKDYLGNNRIVIDEDGQIIQQNNYYPFGMSHPSPLGEGQGVRTDSVPYKFSGKELESEGGLNLYDFSARFYDASTGRFGQIDPMSEKYYAISPYAYCANNPIIFIDPSGMDWYRDKDGNTVWRTGDAAKITIDDVEYTNIGTSYTHDLGGGVSITFNQQSVVSMTFTGITADNWESQISNQTNCYEASSKMLNNENVETAGRGTEVLVTNSAENGRAGTASSNAQKGFNIIDNALENGNPIIVGVDYKDGSPNRDGMTDHFIVVSSKTEILNNGYVTSKTYNFFDPGTSFQSRGVSTTNQLIISGNKMTGTYVDKPNEPYTVVTVRRNQ